MGNIISSKYDAPYKYFSEVTTHRELFDQLRLHDADIGKAYTYVHHFVGVNLVQNMQLKECYILTH